MGGVLQPVVTLHLVSALCAKTPTSVCRIHFHGYILIQSLTSVDKWNRNSYDSLVLRSQQSRVK